MRQLSYPQRSRALSTIGAAVAALLAANAAAQQSTDAPSSVREVEEVIVTGSRIARSNDTTSTPLQVVSALSLEDEGAVDIGQSINNIPAVANVNLSTETSNTGQYNAGITGVNLRALGEMRTLVLVNGRRYVSGIQNQGVVDLSTIPAELVERIEVMTGGASAVYGSDAIGGVVNVILRKQFEGLRFSTQYGRSDQGDGGSEKFSVLAGTVSGDQRMSAMGYIGFNDSEKISAADRDFSRDTILLNNLANPSSAIVGPAANSAVTGRQTIFFPNSTNASATAIRTVVLPDGSLAPYDPARDGLNNQDYRLLRMPARRYQLAGLADYRFTDRVRFFLETNFARSETDAEIQPTFFQTGSTANIGGASPNAIPVTIPVDNPFIPAGIRAQIPVGRTQFGFGRLLYELGARQYAFDRDMYRGVVGLDGTFAAPFSDDDDWRWETSYTYGRTSTYILQHLASIVNMYDGLRVEPNPAGGFQCTDVAARARGCIPINLFTGQSFTPQELAWLAADGSVNSDVDQQVAVATLTGDLFDLPAGAVGAAVGVEWREETSSFQPDTAFANGLLSGAQQFPVSGEFSVREAFIELNVPVLKDLPLVERLDLEAAYRTADYSSIGNADSWKFGGSWKPIEDLRLRAVKARAVRAPNIGELFAPPTYGGASALDPCSGGGRITGLDPARAAARQAYCASIGITPAYIQPNPIVFTYTGGNEELDAETADTLTVGLVYTPRFLPGASLSVDYYDIAIDDAISNLGTQLLLDNCADSSDPFFCENITRSPTTLEVTRVDNPTLNVATIETQGVDLELGYQRPIDSLGAQFGLSLNYTHLLKFETQPLASAQVIVSDGLSTFPQDKANLRLSLDRGPWHVSLRQRYIGPTKRILTLSFDGNEIPSFFYTDAQLRYTHDQRYSVYLGVDNLFDKEPPIIPVGYPGNVFGYNTDPRTYDTLGRMMYIGMSAQF
jgi:iron complex outermembrane recepter protein